MNTGNVSHVRHIFKEFKALKVYAIYELTNVFNGSNQLTETIRIEQFRGFSKGKGFDEYLRLRNTKNWAKCEQVTGLKYTKVNHIFYGDHKRNGVKSLIIFNFSGDRKILTIDYFTGFYPKNEIELREFLIHHISEIEKGDIKTSPFICSCFTGNVKLFKDSQL